MGKTPRLCRCWIDENRVEMNVVVSHPFNEPIKNEQLTNLFKEFGRC